MVINGISTEIKIGLIYISGFGKWCNIIEFLRFLFISMGRAYSVKVISAYSILAGWRHLGAMV